MSELLQWAKNERRTGSLVVRRSTRQKRLLFDNGNVVGCVSDDPADFFGQSLLLRGLLNERQLVEALGRRSKTGRRLGETLVELELLSKDEVREALAQQISDAVCGLFLWSAGVFYFEKEEVEPEALLPAPIETMGLVLEGSRWIDEMRRIRRIVLHDNVVLRQGPAWPGSSLDPVEERVLSVVDGERSLAEIHRFIKGSYFRVVNAAYRLCLKEVLDLGAIGEAFESASIEINVYDLLLEQAHEEQRERLGRDTSLPLALVAGLRPVWVDEPTSGELAELPGALRELAQQLDGEHPLGRWMNTSDADLEQEYLLEQIAKGRLALLPQSPRELAARSAAVAQPAGKAQGWLQRLFSGRGTDARD